MYTSHHHHRKRCRTNRRWRRSFPYRYAGWITISDGENNYGQLGNGDRWDHANTPQKIIKEGVAYAAGGENHSLIVMQDGSLLAMGRNNFGQLGNGDRWNDANTPQKIIKEGVVHVTAGDDHSLVVMKDGSLMVMGDNSIGQLGTGNTSPLDTPTTIIQKGVYQVAASSSHSLILMDDGSLLEWDGIIPGNLALEILYGDIPCNNFRQWGYPSRYWFRTFPSTYERWFAQSHGI